MRNLFLRRFVFTVAPLLVTGTVMLLAIFGEHGVVRKHELLLQQERLEARLNGLRLENANLRREVVLLESDARAVRRLVASELNQAPEGARIFVFRDEDEAP